MTAIDGRIDTMRLGNVADQVPGHTVGGIPLIGFAAVAEAAVGARKRIQNQTMMCMITVETQGLIPIVAAEEAAAAVTITTAVVDGMVTRIVTDTRPMVGILMEILEIVETTVPAITAGLEELIAIISTIHRQTIVTAYATTTTTIGIGVNNGD